MNDDLRFYLGILKRRFLPFIAVFAVLSAIATVIVLAIPPLFRSQATLLVEAQQIPGDLVRTIVTGSPEARIQITGKKLAAREELLRIANKFDLFPGDRATMSATKLVDQMRSRITIEAAETKGKQVVNANGSVSSIAFSIGFDYERPEVAAKVANELLELILTDDISQQTVTASETVDFFNGESRRLATELAKLEEIITKFKLENRDALPDRVPLQMASLERSQSNLKEIDREIDSLIEEKRLLELELKVREAGQARDGASPGTLSQQVDDLKRQLTEAKATFADGHPTIKTLKLKIKLLEEQLRATALTPSAETERDLEEEKQQMSVEARVAAEKRDAIDRKINLYQTQKQSIEQQVNTLTKILSDAPEVQGRINELERQRIGLQKSIDDVSSKLSQALLAKQVIDKQKGERFRVIEQPIVPQDPIWPKVPKLLAAGYGTAAMAGAGLVALLELLNRSVRSANDIVKALNRYPMVVIPYIMTKEEGRRRFRKYVYFAAAIIAALLLAVLAVNFLFMRIDDLWFKVLGRLGI